MDKFARIVQMPKPLSWTIQLYYWAPTSPKKCIKGLALSMETKNSLLE